MADKLILAGADFASDSATPCKKCGSTLAAYRLDREPDGCRRVDVQCASCYAVDYFFPRDTPATVIECTRMHKEAING